MKPAVPFVLLSAILGFAGCADAPVGDSVLGDTYDDAGIIDDKVVMLTNDQAAQAQRTSRTDISYHSGPVMTGGVHIYYIWYGNWTGNTATTILPDLAGSIGGSPYWNINTSYYSQSGTTKTYIPNSVSYSGSTTAASTYGTSLSDTNVLQVVQNTIGTSAPDANAIYFVLTSADVNETSGFCSSYCGWHSHATINGVDTKYAFVGNPDRCLSSCAAQSSSPNGNAGADGMASIIAHEAEEAATDPDFNGWYDRSGYENADKCAWTFGATSRATNGSSYNVTLGARQYLIQQNWSASTQACTMSR